FLHDLYREAAGRWPLLDKLVPEQLPYDARSSFSLTLNHRETFTGITHADRALTVSQLGKLASLEPCISNEELQDRFVAEFRIPGHVHICSAAPGLVSERTGHTELAVTLARMAGIPEALVGAEILHGDGALSPEDARDRAEELGLPFVHGEEIIRAWGSIQEPHEAIPAGT
ncbi:MAG: 3,4-dihydroxy-2-butanone-4-phosphate synthase, partial [Candidatus Thermoplasmatota archaeon]|nr:3,4-dihydroxy-2-butanone-4-phosphate synthase [Candidatus Thermoplasmatota archaeon]